MEGCSVQTVIKYNRHRPGNDRFVLTDAHMLVCPHTTCMPPQTSVCVLHSSPVSAQSGICSRTTDASQAWSRLKKSSTLTICSFGACSENRFFFFFLFFFFAPASWLYFPFNYDTSHQRAHRKLWVQRSPQSQDANIMFGSVVYFLSFSLLQAFGLHDRPPLITCLGFILFFFFFTHLSHLFKHDLIYLFIFALEKYRFAFRSIVPIVFLSFVSYVLQAAV